MMIMMLRMKDTGKHWDSPDAENNVVGNSAYSAKSAFHCMNDWLYIPICV